MFLAHSLALLLLELKCTYLLESVRPFDIVATLLVSLVFVVLFCFCFFLFGSCFGYFSWLSCKFTDSFLSWAKSTDDTIKKILHLKHFVPHFLVMSTFLWKFFVCSCMLSICSTALFYILTILLLPSLRVSASGSLPQLCRFTVLFWQWVVFSCFSLGMSHEFWPNIECHIENISGWGKQKWPERACLFIFKAISIEGGQDLGWSGGL